MHGGPQPLQSVVGRVHRLRWPEVFSRDVLMVRKRLGGVTATQAEVIAEALRLWQGCATLVYARR